MALTKIVGKQSKQTKGGQRVRTSGVIHSRQSDNGAALRDQAFLPWRPFHPPEELLEPTALKMGITPDLAATRSVDYDDARKFGRCSRRLLGVRHGSHVPPQLLASSNRNVLRDSDLCPARAQCPGRVSAAQARLTAGTGRPLPASEQFRRGSGFLASWCGCFTASMALVGEGLQFPL